MKINLINPPLSDIEKLDAMKGIANIIPPLGIGYIAAVLEENHYDVRIIDCRINFSWNNFISILKERKSDVAGITITTPSYMKALEVTKAVRNLLPKAIIVAGGPHVTAMPKETIQDGNFDLGVYSEGEYTFLELINNIVRKNFDYSSIKGLVYKNIDGKVVFSQEREYIQNLDVLPFPTRHLYPPLTEYKPMPASYMKLPFAHMITSRGCPYQCIFCDRKVFGNKFRARSARNVINEIEELIEKYNVKEIKFFDDTFTLSQERVFEICDGIGRLKKKIVWSCLARVDNVSKALLKEMKEAGCWQIGLGLESGDSAVLRNSKKGITLAQSRDAVRWAKEVGINVRAFFIIGFPDDTTETIQRTIDFARSLDIDVANFYNLTVYPGTELYDMALREGMLLHKNYQEYLQLSLPDKIKISYLPKRLSEKELRKMLKKAHKEFYLRLSYIISQIKQIKTIEDIKRYLRGLLAILGI